MLHGDGGGRMDVDILWIMTTHLFGEHAPHLTHLHRERVHALLEGGVYIAGEGCDEATDCCNRASTLPTHW